MTITESNGTFTFAATDTNTHNSHIVYSGKKSDGTTDISSGTASSGNITLGDSGVTAGAYGDTTDQTPGYNATFKVPSISVNAKGIVTAIGEHTVKIPASDNHRHLKSGDSGRDNGVYTYYKLASFPADNTGNSCSLTVDGRIGGWNNGNKGYISMIISNRDGVDATGTLLGNAGLSLCDLVVYTSGTTSTNSTAILYAKTYSWFAFDLTLGAMSGVEDIYDGNGVTATPTGTLA